MVSAAAQEMQEMQEAERLVATVPLIPEVSAINVELYTDNTGDPSFQLIFHIRPDVATESSEFIRRFLDFAAVVQTKILHSNLRRFPYTKLEQAA